MKETYQTLVQIVVDVGKELGLNVRSQDVLGSSDRDTVQLAKLVVDTCEELVTRFPWRKIIGTEGWVVQDNGTHTWAPSADTDTILMDSRTVKAGAKWRYLNSKGLTYDEQFRIYENRINAFAFDQNMNTVADTNAPGPIPI